ncbi:hypothetical protein COW46_03465 [Candidatus Gracilibacteria bacterium CG17_big_fil_post_rev_8_21_14_2_50_48_13]|nr:MAG: hypothetical protein COW46_03465 [Candidatus Gracilibacteria bacterium CG17_big_fil_post_rev_8_21_14_2_50_48_13]
MKLEILFIQSDKDFTPEDKVTLRALIEEHAEKAAAALPFTQSVLTLTVYPWIKKGSSAFTKTRDWIRIMLNPEELSGQKREQTLNQLIYMLYHEMHHACRGYAGYLGTEHILIGSMISEGMADYFVREHYPSEHVLQTTSFDLAEIAPFLERLDAIKMERESDHEEWMYGDEEKPRLFGYKVGRYLMQRVFVAHPEQNAVRLLTAGIDDVLKLSGSLL